MILPRRPRLRIDSPASLDSRGIFGPPSSFTATSPSETSSYPHVSVYRSPQIEIQLHSPSAKVVQKGNQIARLLPVFGERDRVEGKVGLDPSCSQSGRLCISIEGVFSCSSQNTEEESSTKPKTRKRKHVFFSISRSISVSSSSDRETNSPRSGFREAFGAVRRRPSLSGLNSPTVVRFYPFSFDIPRSPRAGEEMPSSFSSLDHAEIGPHGVALTEGTEVAYKVTASWEANDVANRAVLDAPFLFQPDADFQSLDVLSLQPDAWLEMPLRSDRPIPFQCAITLPSPVAFHRAASVPYFVVFTTTPRTSSLAREIAADATISVSLLRQITIKGFVSRPPTTPDTPTTSGEESEPSSQRHRKILNLVVNSARSARNPEEIQNLWTKPLPETPTPAAALSDCRTLSASMCIGFPKRPRNRCAPDGHPALASHTSLPDGLYKGKIQLNKEMLPCIDWAGLTVKYYLDISVLIGQDDLRARVPIQIT